MSQDVSGGCIYVVERDFLACFIYIFDSQFLLTRGVNCLNSQNGCEAGWLEEGREVPFPTTQVLLPGPYIGGAAPSKPALDIFLGLVI